MYLRPEASSAFSNARFEKAYEKPIALSKIGHLCYAIGFSSQPSNSNNPIIVPHATSIILHQEIYHLLLLGWVYVSLTLILYPKGLNLL